MPRTGIIPRLLPVLLIAVTEAMPQTFNKGYSVHMRADRELWRHTTFTSGSHMLSAFHPHRLWGYNSLSVVRDPGRGSDHVLRVHCDRGSYYKTHRMERGAGFYSDTASSCTGMMLSYDVFFSDNFDFVKGGKLPGLWGGSTKCQGGQHSDDCFTTRFMWREGGEGEVYAYIPRHHQDSDFCHRSNVICNFDYGDSLGRGQWKFQTNRWQNIAQYIHLNTPGQTDGFLRVYLDGHEVFEMKDLAFRTENSVRINGIYFNSFFGGGDSSWASKESCHTYFRNFVLSKDSTHPTIIGK